MLDAIAARSPAPGGGVSAAVSALVGVTTVRMVLAFSNGEKYAAVRDDLDAIAALADTADERLRTLTIDDQAAFLATKQKDLSDAERSERLAEAAAVPLRLIAACMPLLDRLPRLREVGNRNLASDVVVAAHLLRGAIHAAAALSLSDADRRVVHDQLGASLDDVLANADKTCSVMARVEGR